MAGAVELTQADMEARFTARRVKDTFCDNGSNTVGPRLAPALSAGRRIADAILMAAWTPAQIEVLMDEDDAVRNAALDLAMSEGMVGRMEWEVAGGPRETLRKSAIETLKMLAQGQLRSIGEANGAGVNPHLKRASVHTERVPHTFVFASSKALPTRGGF